MPPDEEIPSSLQNYHLSSHIKLTAAHRQMIHGLKSEVLLVLSTVACTDIGKYMKLINQCIKCLHL